ncbi:toxin-antitoxin system HicB family antitoxin [Terriglobus sp. ADX1]|uniref:toxin-antitoxin system HicB family antitoxin n=1 Tax=Terriglobus sp. ADX1 TaxID=2794063 RepID=UPI002FE63DA3
MEQKKVLSFPLRLSPSVRMQATDLARLEGISLNHFISLAVAEKISRMEHESWLRQQGKTASSSLSMQTPLSRRF